MGESHQLTPREKRKLPPAWRWSAANTSVELVRGHRTHAEQPDVRALKRSAEFIQMEKELGGVVE